MTYYTLEDSSTLTFRVFNRLIVSFQGITSNQEFLENWSASEFDDETARGVAFLGHHRVSSDRPAPQIPPLELTIADATQDPEEPFVSQIDDKTLDSTDQQLRDDLARDYDIVDWRGSKLRPNKCGIKTLVTRYSHAFDGHVYDVYAVRQQLLVEKLVMLTVVDADYAPRYRTPLESVLRRIVLS